MASSVTHFLSVGPSGIQDWAHDNTRPGLEARFDPTSQREEKASSRYDTRWLIARKISAWITPDDKTTVAIIYFDLWQSGKQMKVRHASSH